ncbi:LPXTG cell wall anchor domain-containing protein [Pseudoneobacillus sp. C159]
MQKNRLVGFIAFCCLLWTFTPNLLVLADSQVETTSASEIEVNNSIVTASSLELSTTRHTGIHLHLSNCPEVYTQIFVKIKGEWLELTQQGNSALYKALDGGEFVSDDIREFKFITEAKEEMIVSVSEIKVGVEAEGTINYWLEKCLGTTQPIEAPKDDNNIKNTQIHIHLKDCPQEFLQVFVRIKEEWLELIRQGNSSLYKAPDGGEYVQDDISEFKFIIESKKEIILPVNELKVGMEAQGTINYWLEKCLQNEDPPSDEGGIGPVDGEENNDEDPVIGGGNDDLSSHPPGQIGGDDGTNVDSPTGTLPQTGDTGNLFYYVFGLVLISLGAFLLLRKKGSMV